MNNTVLLALIDAMVSEAISKIDIPSGTRGPRGLPGKDGNDFSIDDHRELLKQFILDHLPKNIELTSEQIQLLKGTDGKDGLDGRDGRHGRDFIFEEHEERITQIIKAVSLKFEDLTEDQINSLKGRDGVDGKDGLDGKDFSFEESQEQINNLIVSYLSAVKDSLKLNFSDLTPEEKDSLRGPRGQRGKMGKDFIFEEHESRISEILDKLVQAKRDELRLRFNDLSPKEKEELKLKFTDLTDEERDLLRGPRGQRGKIGLPGKDGRDGIDGKDGKSIMGPPGISGKDGRDGRDGRDGVDGEDAPKIIDVSIDQIGRDLTFNFDFDDGSTLKTNTVELPKSVSNSYFAGGGGGGGSGTPGADGKSAYQIALQNGFIGTESEWLDSLVGPQGLPGEAGPRGEKGDQGLDGKSAYQIAVDNGFVGTEEEWLDSLSSGGNGSSLTIVDENAEAFTDVRQVSFIGDYVKVYAGTTMSEWPLLSEINSLSDYSSGNSEKVEVAIEVPDTANIRDVDCANTVYVGSFVRMDSQGVAHNALADLYENSNVIGVVESKPSLFKCNLRLFGKTSKIFENLDTTLDYFLSSTVPGGLTSIPPRQPGNVVLKLGQAFSSDTFVLSKGERMVKS